MNNRKTPGVDRIPTELLRNGKNEILERLFNLVGKIYEPGELLISRNVLAVIIRKKKGAENVTNVER